MPKIPFDKWKIGPGWPGQRCGATCKRTGEPCKNPAMRNGKCRMHGGQSTGPRTEEGKRRIAHAQWKHGKYSKLVREFQTAFEYWERSKRSSATAQGQRRDIRGRFWRPPWLESE